MKLVLVGYDRFGDVSRALDSVSALFGKDEIKGSNILFGLTIGERQEVSDFNQVGSWPHVLRFIAAGGKVEVS